MEAIKICIHSICILPHVISLAIIPKLLWAVTFSESTDWDIDNTYNPTGRPLIFYLRSHGMSTQLCQ